MQFPSVEFLFFFLPIFFLIYFSCKNKNRCLLVASLVFYTWGEGYYLAVLLLTIYVNFTIANSIYQTTARKKRFLYLGIAINILILGHFKYGNFILQDVFDFNYVIQNRLPLGISFFIFQSLSYLGDVYRGTAKPARSLEDLALYISMFPQLIAGPIVRYSSVASDIYVRNISTIQIRDGCLFFIGGLSQKVLIANNVAEIADSAFSLKLEQLSTLSVLIGTAAYTLQIYFDFSGYSMMAIGIGLIIGFRYPVNFNYPYISQSITEFWQRWHMSLGAWFKDYVYIPLGGNTSGSVRTYLNLFLVFFLCGIWHGAAWNFIFWGVYFGLFLIIERDLRHRNLPAFPKPVRWLYTVLVVAIGWIFFRADSLSIALQMIKTIFLFTFDLQPVLNSSLTNENLFFLCIGLIASTPIVRHVLIKLQVYPSIDVHSIRTPIVHFYTFLGASILFFICTMYIFSGTYNPFIYFRF